MKTQKGKEYPTMKSHEVEEEKECVTKLQKQFMDLQQDWDSYKSSNPKTKRRSHSTSSSNFTMEKNLDQLLDTSPRHLMSSLQHRRSPLEGEWRVRTNDLVVEEIRRDRRAAIESGKLKGRRLFEVEDCETEMGFGGRERNLCGWNGLVQESEVRSASFDDSDGDDDDDDSGKSKEIAVCFQGSKTSSSSSSLTDDNAKRDVKIVEEMKMVTVEEKRVDNNYEGGNGGKCMVMIMLWLAIASLVFAICFISGFAGYANENEVILVPT